MDEVVTKLKTFEKGQTEFTANGTKYFIESGISFKRQIEYDKLMVELAYGISVQKMFDEIGEAFDLLNSQEFANAAVLMHTLQSGLAKNIEGRWTTGMRLCTLFINAEGEDRRVINEETISKKINDWSEEGYDWNAFFQFAFNTIPGFVSLYNSIIQNGLKAQKEKQKKNTHTLKQKSNA